MHSLTKLWLKRWLVGLWQCVQCGSAIVLKNVRWAKNKKHWVGLSVGSLVLSIFRFSVLSQWFTFQYFNVVVFLLHLAVTVRVLPQLAISEHYTVNQHKSLIGALSFNFTRHRQLRQHAVTGWCSVCPLKWPVIELHIVVKLETKSSSKT